MFTRTTSQRVGGDIEAGGSTVYDQDVEKWADSLSKILDDVPEYICSPGHQGGISRIPQNLREIDVKAYEPYFVSIGPYHHDKPMVISMEKRKRLVLRVFLHANPELRLKEYLNELKSIEQEARRFYSDVEMDSDKFVSMLLLDSIFVLSVFCGMPESQERMNRINSRIRNREDMENQNHGTNHINDEMGSDDDNNENMQMIMRSDEFDETETRDDIAPRMLSALFIHDFFLLENQLPFFVLQKLHTLAYSGSQTKLIDIMKDRIGNMFLEYTKSDSELVVSSAAEVHHLLHLCHMFFRPTFQEESTSCQLPESSQMFRLGNAVQLYESGVSFVPQYNSTRHSLLDITFSRSGKIIMPCLCVDDNTNSLLRNLIALEQMKYPNLGLDVSAYAVLLLHLVTTPDDAKLLRKKGIIEHHLASDKEMMYLVNKLSVGLSFDYAEDNYSLKPVFQELKRYTELKVPRWRAWLKHKYFNNPWTMISVVAATILLFFTVVQTYFTVYSYYLPCDDCHS